MKKSNIKVEIDYQVRSNADDKIWTIAEIPDSQHVAIVRLVCGESYKRTVISIEALRNDFRPRSEPLNARRTLTPEDKPIRKQTWGKKRTLYNTKQYPADVRYRKKLKDVRIKLREDKHQELIQHLYYYPDNVSELIRDLLHDYFKLEKVV